MELNYGNILDIIIESESLESPDWIWKARVGGDFYPGHWVCAVSYTHLTLPTTSRV